MAKKAIICRHSIWSLISDDSRRALIALIEANVEFANRQLEFKLANRQLKKAPAKAG